MLKACGGCKELLYCSVECQRKHWKVHKSDCKKKGVAETSRANVPPPTAQIASVPASGLDVVFKFAEDIGGLMKGGGVVACQRIPRGTIVMREAPLLSIRGEEVGESDLNDTARWSSRRLASRFNKQFPAIWQKFSRLPEEAKGRYLALADTTTHSKRQRALIDRLRSEGEISKTWEKVFSLTSVPAPVLDAALHTEGMKSVEGIFCTNCIPGARNEQAVYSTICRVNHSCVANAAYKWREDERMQVVLATRDIEAGEEICVSYFDGRFQSMQKRKDRTVFSWGFECQCEACSMPGFQLKSEFGRGHVQGRTGCDPGGSAGKDRGFCRI